MEFPLLLQILLLRLLRLSQRTTLSPLPLLLRSVILRESLLEPQVEVISRLSIPLCPHICRSLNPLLPLLLLILLPLLPLAPLLRFRVIVTVV